MTNFEFKRKSRNLLITGHSESRLPKEDSDKRKIFEALENVTIAIASVSLNNFGAQLRIITGLFSGTDASAADIAQKRKIPLHVIAPCPTRDDSSFKQANSRLPKEDSDKRKIFEAFVNVTIDIESMLLSHFGAQFRIITGLFSGTDAKAVEIAKNRKIPLHVIVPCLSSDDSSVKVVAERISLIRNIPINKDKYPETFNAINAAADEAKLALADAIIVVWDGNAPQGCAGGSVRTLIEAIRLFTPIIWIHASPDEAGMVSVIDPSKLDASTLVNLDVDKSNVDNLKKLFLKVTNPPTKEKLLTILLPFWETRNITEIMAVLKLKDIDPQDKPTFAGFWHWNFLPLFGYEPKRCKPKVWRKSVIPFRGPDDFWKACELPDSTWEWFDQFDRVATHAANRHRDQVVITHLLSSFAVLGAVAGAINWLGRSDFFWGWVEFLTLFVIGWIVWNNKPSKHSVWMGFRQAVEAIRMSALLHPMLANLPALHRRVWQNSSVKTNPKTKALNVVKPYQWIVIQLLREAGTPNITNYCLENNIDTLKKALTKLIKNQIEYHNDTFKRNEKASHRLHLVTKVVYFLVIATVAVHLGALGIHALAHQGRAIFAGLISAADWIHEQRWLLLVTAFFPALAAGLHGITSTLELERLANNSKKMRERLESLNNAVNEAEDVMYIRALAIEVATSMYAEHDAWAGLMEEQSLGIPA